VCKKAEIDSAAAGIEPATSSRKSNALTTAPPSHTMWYTMTSRKNPTAKNLGPHVERSITVSFGVSRSLDKRVKA